MDLLSPNNYDKSALIIGDALSRHRFCVGQLIEQRTCIEQAACLAALLKIRFDEGHKLLICGNGGSAADAQHFSAELTIRYRQNRRALPAISLTTDTSALTACANDLGYSQVFERQVEALGRPGDVLVCFSTSGNSKSVHWAMKHAKLHDIFTVGFTGAAGSHVSDTADWCIRVPSTETARIQEMHQILYHGICESLDALYGA